MIKDGWIKSQKILIMLSGGPDSVYLLHKLVELRKENNFELHAFHLNHKLREEANFEEEFVKQLALKLEVTLHLRSCDISDFSKKKKISIEMAGREYRYLMAQEIVRNNNIDSILTAHHRDDLVETFFLNLFYGAGINGLTSIKYQNNNIYRPLLDMDKKDIVDYLDSRNIDYKVDESNRDLKYKRNEIRHRLIPVLEEISPNFRDKIEQSISHLISAKNVLRKYYDRELFRDVIELKKIRDMDDDVRINYLYLLLEKNGDLQNTSSKEISELNKFILTSNGGHRDVSSHTYSISCGKMVVRGKSDNSYTGRYSELNEGINKVFDLIVSIDIGQAIFDENTHSIPFDKATPPFVLRNMKEDDYFNPVGVSYTKKLNKFLKDQKIPSSLRNELLLLADQKEVYWVLDVRKSQIETTCDKYYRIKIEKA